MWSGPASLYVLVALADGPSHGLGIADNVADFTDGSVLLGPGTLYRVLKDLSDDALIQRTEVPESEDPRRKYYALTEAGRAELRTALTEIRAVYETGSSRIGGLRPREA